MTEYSVTLLVPTDIYNRASHIAKVTVQSIEAVLLQHLKEAFADPRTRSSYILDMRAPSC